MATTGYKHCPFDTKSWGYYVQLTYTAGGGNITITSIQTYQDSTTHSYSAYYANTQNATLTINGKANSISGKFAYNSTSAQTVWSGSVSGSGSGVITVSLSFRGRASSPYMINASYSIDVGSPTGTLDVNPIINGTAQNSGLDGFTFSLNGSGTYTDYYNASASPGTYTATPYAKTGYSTSGASGTLSAGGTLILQPTWTVNRYWNDVNIISPGPNGTQNYQAAYFDLYTSENNSWRYGLTDQDGDMTHAHGTYFEITNIQPYYPYYEVDRVEGYDSIPSTGTYRKTFDGEGEVMTVYMRYKSYYDDINAYQPDGVTQNGLIFDLVVKNREGTVVNSWANITNEPESGFRREWGYTGTISNIRSNVPGAHYSSNNVTNNNASSFTWTFDSEKLINLYTAWNEHNMTIRISDGIADITSPAWAWNGNTKTGTVHCNDYFTLNVTTHQGYHFTHYSGSISANIQNYSFTLGDQDYDITAHAAPNTYVVQYNPNGGSGTTSNSNHTYNIAQNLTRNGFSKPGYRFVGWSTETSATEATYENGESVINLTDVNNGVVNLYAVWKEFSGGATTAYIKINGEWLLGTVYYKKDNNWIQPISISIIEKEE